MRWFLVRVQDLEPILFMQTSTPILIKALEILSKDIQSEDGVANAAILEASIRLKELDNRIIELEDTIHDIIKVLNEIV